MLNRPRIIGHGALYRGDPEKLLTTLPRTDADVQVFMVGPFTKQEKIMAVEPIQCNVEKLRNLWKNMITYNKGLAAVVDHDLDEDTMTALEASLVYISNADEPAEEGTGTTGSDEHRQHQPAAPQATSSSISPGTSAGGITYIGTNLLETADNDRNTNAEPNQHNEDDDDQDVGLDHDVTDDEDESADDEQSPAVEPHAVHVQAADPSHAANPALPLQSIDPA